MTLTSLGNPDKTKDHAYLRNKAVKLFANPNEMYNFRSHNKMQEKNLHAVLDVTDSTAVWKRSINSLQDEVASISERLQVLEQSVIDIHDTQEMYRKDLRNVEGQRYALANEIRDMETAHMRSPHSSFM